MKALVPFHRARYRKSGNYLVEGQDQTSSQRGLLPFTFGQGTRELGKVKEAGRPIHRGEDTKT